jgi:hypothetical protein
VLYIVVPTCDSYPACPGNTLKVYRGNQPGTPTQFIEEDAAHAPSGEIGSSAIAIDGSDVIHALWNDRYGRVRYGTFSPVSGTWMDIVTLAQTNWTTFGQGDEGVALAISNTGEPHAAWNGEDASAQLHIYHAFAVQGLWTSPTQVDDVPLDVNHSAWHPTLAFAPDGRLVLAWLDGTFNGADDGVIRVRERLPTGDWTASIAISDQARTSIDNGPSLLITTDNVQHLTFVNYGDVVRYWYNDGSGWRGELQPPNQVTHDPSLGPDCGGGVYIYGHGTPQGSIDGHGDDLFRFHKPRGGSWGAWTHYTTGSFDSSVSTRWSQFFFYHQQIIDVVYWSDPYPNVLYFGTSHRGSIGDLAQGSASMTGAFGCYFKKLRVGF